MRLLPVFAVAALLAAPASTPMAAPPVREKPAAATLDPDRFCKRILQGFRERDEQAYTSGTAVYAPSPPPPPPPPPPPAPPPPPPGQVEITGSRIPQPNLASPTPITVVNSAEVGYLRSPENRERYEANPVSTIQAVADAPVSTFAVDVDTGSYANVRRMLTAGEMPPPDAVRTEELLNYFRYDYPLPPDRARPFSVTTDVALTPWNAETRLLRIGLRGYDVARSERPPANLVFLVDVSGSMEEPDKLPLVQCSLALLAEQLTPRDRVSIVVYAGNAGLVLPPTYDKAKVVAALARLQAGGSTAGGEGIALAYRIAEENRIEGGINRIFLATDGDFNVGVTDTRALIGMVERERDKGITLTTLGFGTGNFNDAMMEQIADHGNGNYAYVDGPREAQKVLGEELSSTLFTIAKDVKVQVEFNPAYVREYRLIGYENRALTEQDFSNDKVDAGDIGASHQVTALYEIVPAGAKGWLPDRHFAVNRRDEAGAANGQLAWLRLRYKLPDASESKLIEQPIAAGLVASAGRPSGDTAFAAAVAGFGQKLRHDPWLKKFDYADARRLAASAGTGDYWRREFLKLVDLADSSANPPADR
ncbi:MAG: Ca-activated chloride channel [Sphingomonadales bacterium]|jgi:Ca-activated chloride channel family protein|nr:Ca-activated chloride channel [Sphingomonadales bacterium]